MAKLKKKTDVYQIITDKIVELLEKGVVPWHQSWWTTTPKSIRGHKYRGINVFLLACTPYSSPYWITWDQVKKMGGQVKESERKNYQQIIFWKRLVVDDTDDAGKKVQKSIPLLRYFRVYNVEQCEGIEVPATDGTELDFNLLDAAEAIVSKYETCPEINHGGNRASYNTVSDQVSMPDKERFDSVETYYATLFHELIHSTGHSTRLKRFGSEDNSIFEQSSYSKEELIAELGAAFLGAESGIGEDTIENSAAYVKSWLKRLQDDQKLIVLAAAKAQKAADLVLGRTWDEAKTESKEKQTA